MNDRSLNIDLLRLMAMFFVVLFHFFIHGVMHKHTYSEFGYGISFESSLIEIIVYIISESCIVVASTGVNLFVMMSGYLLISRIDFRIKSLLKLWLKGADGTDLSRIGGCTDAF